MPRSVITTAKRHHLRVCRKKSVDARLAAAGRHDRMTVASNVSRSDWINTGSSSTTRIRSAVGRRMRRPQHRSRHIVRRQAQKLRRMVVPLPSALSISISRPVPLHHAIDHGKPEARAALAFGGEERLQAAAAGVLVHADAGVGHLDVNLRARRSRRTADSALRVRSVSVPPSGMASTALKIRLMSASRISLSTPMIVGQVRRQLGSQSRSRCRAAAACRSSARGSDRRPAGTRRFRSTGASVNCGSRWR